MKIVFISDTHSKHEKLTNFLPDGDLIIHSGDFTSMGREHEIVNFFKWYSKLDQYKYKICIAGNHDWLFETNRPLSHSLIPSNIIYLEDSGVEINGIKFYGSPVSKPFCNWAFNRPEEKLQQHWEAIPDNVDVLITHTPPYSILDYVSFSGKHEGSPTLYNEIFKRIKPQICCFGHIHEGNGIKDIDGIKFINASNLDDEYLFTFNPIVNEI